MGHIVMLVAAMPSTKDINGCQVAQNFLVDPLIVYLIRPEQT